MGDPSLPGQPQRTLTLRAVCGALSWPAFGVAATLLLVAMDGLARKATYGTTPSELWGAREMLSWAVALLVAGAALRIAAERPSPRRVLAGVAWLVLGTFMVIAVALAIAFHNSSCGSPDRRGLQWEQPGFLDDPQWHADYRLELHRGGWWITWSHDGNSWSLHDLGSSMEIRAGHGQLNRTALETELHLAVKDLQLPQPQLADARITLGHVC